MKVAASLLEYCRQRGLDECQTCGGVFDAPGDVWRCECSGCEQLRHKQRIEKEAQR